MVTSYNQGSAAVRNLVEGSLAAALGNTAERRKLEAPDLVLRPQQAVALAMIVHELATTALKYGALSASGGRVAIAGRAETGRETAAIALDWSESSGPPVDRPERKGLDSRLILSGLGGRYGAVHID